MFDLRLNCGVVYVRIFPRRHKNNISFHWFFENWSTLSYKCSFDWRLGSGHGSTLRKVFSIRGHGITLRKVFLIRGQIMVHGSTLKKLFSIRGHGSILRKLFSIRGHSSTLRKLFSIRGHGSTLRKLFSIRVMDVPW